MNFKLDQTSSIPLHAQIEQYLRKLILKKEYKNGDKFLPKEVTMSKRLGVSRNTIRQAINKLASEGLIERKKGIGTKVITKRISTRLDNWISFTKEMRNQGIEVVQYLMNLTLVEADDAVYEALSLDKSKKIWKLEKIRGSKEAKYLYSISYFHPRVGISGNENFIKPLYEVLERDHDIIVSVSKEKLRAVKADEALGNILDIENDSAILKRERLVCDAGDRPVEYNIVYYNTEFFTYDIDIKREL